MSAATKDPAPDAQSHGGLDQELLDRMIGAKGDTDVIELSCQNMLAGLCPLLETAFYEATGVQLVARPGDILQGRRRDLLTDLGLNAVYCEARISGWSKDISALCGTQLIIGLVECLLGGSDPDDLSIAARPLSGIELDMSLVVFEQLNESLLDLVTDDPRSKSGVDKPQSEMPPEEDDPRPNFHSAAITIDLEFGAVTAPLTLVLPQALLLKTVLKTPKGRKAALQEKGEWAERLSERVSRSQVDLKAAVALAPLPLGDISRLQPGDLIGFADNGDIEVTLSANGKALYTCALGRAGSRYMVKIERQAGPDENWRSEFS
ncbi:FliM/FliN family flagellar motor switch protein [uncultured Hoeflea sp.]|uniref:FliM/FliN family flagellar motor switch protein n=1 Tax=uncultured Hoeflea sp. TaxID=538666 RepID=UPI0026093C64|nr:FliM/FliN family flagellar motor switch protein [uncultured Hoeflea sp.]